MDAVQMAIEERVFEQHRHHSKGQFFWVWGALLVMTGIEVYLAYQNMEPVRMLSILMGLSIIKAALIIAYFMHMKFERLSLFLTLFPMLIFCIVLMLIFLGDAVRIPNMRPPV